MTMPDFNAEPLLHVEGLKQYFRISSTFTTKAVDGISFDIYPGRPMVLSANPVPENPRPAVL